MKGTKRFLSWLLVICMMLGMVPAIAFTASATIATSATWTETAWANIADGATIIIANTNNVALPSTTTSSSPTKVNITVSGSAGALTITPASGSLDDIAWTVKGSTTSSTGVQLLQYGSTDVNLRLSGTSSNTALRVAATASNNMFELGSGGKLLKLVGTERYVGEYVAGSDWRTYNTETAANYQSQSLKFYVLNTGSSSGGGGDTGGGTGGTIPAVSAVYMLVTDASQLVAGETYVIAAADEAVAMSTTQNNNNRGQAEVTKDGNLLYFSSAVQEFTLGAGTTSGTYSFYDAANGGYIYAASSSGNYLRTQATLSANSSWTISVTAEGVATVVAQGSYTRNLLQYNASSDIFSCYASAQKDIAIYRKVYSLVTDVSQLQIGDDIVIAAMDYNYAISTTQNTSNREGGVVSKSPADTKYALTFASSANIAEFTLGEGTISGTYSFYDAANSGYLYAPNSTSSGLKTQTSLTANSSWAITVTADGVATVQAQGASTYNTMSFNSSYNRFAAYLPSSLQKDIAIYRRAAASSYYTVSYYVGGELDSSVTTTGSVTLPTDVTFDGWTFLGWVASETSDLIAGTTTQPTYLTGSVTVSDDTSYYALFSYNGTYTTRPTAIGSDAVEASMKIITGAGKAYLYRGGTTTQIALAETKGDEVRVAAVTGETLTLVVIPANGYRIGSIEQSSDRLDPTSDYNYDAALGGYVYSFEVDKSSGNNYFRISFIPRVSDGGYTATQITGWDYTNASGLYVITGMVSPEDYTSNNHNASTTYLLYGDADTAVDDNNAAVGRKSSALQLGEIGVTLNSNSPYLMTGLNQAHIMEFTRYGDTDYFTIRLYGATEKNYYLCAAEVEGSGNKNFMYATDSYMVDANNVYKYALWRVTYLDNGAVQIENHGWEAAVAAGEATATRYLKFNSSSANLQFRCYTDSTTTADFPVLYSASQSNYQVNYSAVGSGSVAATNATTSSAIASGTYQPKDSNITFTFTPATGYQLAGVTVNGTSVTVTGNTFTYTGLDQNITVVATFEELPAAKFTVEYYLNEELKTSREIEAKSPYFIDATVQITYNGTSYPVSQFSFDYSQNGTAIYTDINSAIIVSANDVVKAYFSTTAVDRTKTVNEITQMGAATSALGGEDTDRFTSANEQDTHSNVKQSYRVELNVSSNDMIEGYTKGGNTDIILVLDNSNSMYQPYTDNAKYTLEAVADFAEIAFEDPNSDNRIAIVQYDTLARAWNGSSFVLYNYSMSNSDYPTLTYANCFMKTEAAVNAAAAKALVYNGSQYTQYGMTNTMGGLRMTELVANTRSKSTTRDIVIIMFTDGLPTCRYYTATQDWDKDGDGTLTSAWEFARALEAGVSLRECLDKYTKCNSLIYNVALLNDADMTAEDYLIADYFMSDTAIYQWSYDTNVVSANYQNLRNYVNNRSKYFTKTTPYADEYIKITGDINAAKDLADVFADIAYESVASKYVTGTITDTIPAGFTLTAESQAALIADGCTVKVNSDGTTTITKKVTANAQGAGFTYDIIYQGNGYGSVYTNTSATFEYTNLQTEETNTSYFPMPTVTVIPWTVNDRTMAQLNTMTTIDILGNDLFTELTQGGYTLSNFTVTLTDANGNPTTYNDAIEQVGCGFDANVDPASNTVTFYTEQGGASTFYYVVSATATAPDGTTTTVYSRATQVDVLVSELDKYAKEVTNDTNLPEGVSITTDAHGNVQQLYLVTLTVNMFDIVNGKIVDTIPNDFDFVAFKQTAGTSCTESDNVITCSGITCGSTAQEVVLSYYIRYIGKGYGVRPTNTSATFSYQTSTSSTLTTQDFPVPTAGLNPHTVNDIDIAQANTQYTLDIQDNDLYSTTGSVVNGYTVTSTTTYITDENGMPLTDEEIAALGISLTVNSDGSITYTAPDEEGTTQFYYVVEATVTLPNGENTYAEDNSTTLISRPTLVTIYTVKDTFVVVDFGLVTEKMSFLDIDDINIATDYSDSENVKAVLLSSYLTKGAFNTTDYGVLSYDTTNSMISFLPKTMAFDQTAAYTCQVTLAESVYNSNSKTVKVNFRVIPANNIYYEENFLTFDSAWSDESSADTTAFQDAGDYHNKALHGFDTVYSIQEAYSNGNQKAVTVSKDDIEHTAYFTFTGTGFDIIGSTNSNSGVMVAQVYKYDASAEDGCGDLVKNILVDTWLDGKSYDQIPVIMYRSENYGTYRVKVRAFYNAIFDHNYNPSAVDFTTPTVRKMLGLSANEPLEIQSITTESATISTKELADAQNGQYNVYLDAVRIYNPLNTTGNNAESTEASVYAAAGELNPVFTNVNDKLLTSETWEDNAEKVEGMLYVAADGTDAGSNTDIYYSGVYLSASGQLRTKEGADGKTYLVAADGRNVLYNGYSVYIKPKSGEATVDSSKVSYFYTDMYGVEFELTNSQVQSLGIAYYDDKYEAVGPENEVYLKNGQGVAFVVNTDVSVQISVKVPYGEGYVLLKAWDPTMGESGDWREVANISSRTEMYYRINTNMISSDGLLILQCVIEDDPNTAVNEIANTVLSLCNVKVASGSPISAGEIMPLSYEQMITALYAFAPATEADDTEHTEHTWGEWTVTTEPTCTEEGEETRYCEGCDATETREIEATGHSYGEWSVTEEPTCTEIGEESRYCECGEFETREVAATGHSFTESTVEPTCTEDGAVISTCSVCGHSYESTILSATGHDFGEWVVTLEPTCTEEGAQIRSCSRCDAIESDPIAKLECVTEPFADIESDAWYHDAIDFMVNNGYMNGVAADEFAPSGTVTRAMVVTVLYRIAGSPEVTEKATFTDVADDQWYSDAIAWAQAEGVVNGISETEFAPMASVTREQIAAILYRYSADASVGEDVSLESYPDAASVSEYAVEAMRWAVGEGIFSGDNEGNLNPTDHATRAEFATILYRYLAK